MKKDVRLASRKPSVTKTVFEVRKVTRGWHWPWGEKPTDYDVRWEAVGIFPTLGRAQAEIRYLKLKSIGSQDNVNKWLGGFKNGDPPACVIDAYELIRWNEAKYDGMRQKAPDTEYLLKHPKAEGMVRSSKKSVRKRLRST
jgi:hypothetical protein